MTSWRCTISPLDSHPHVPTRAGSESPVSDSGHHDMGETDCPLPQARSTLPRLPRPIASGWRRAVGGVTITLQTILYFVPWEHSDIENPIPSFSPLWPHLSPQLPKPLGGADPRAQSFRSKVAYIRTHTLPSPRTPRYHRLFSSVSASPLWLDGSLFLRPPLDALRAGF